MKFSTLGGLFSHYHEVRAGLSSVRTGTPTPEAIRQEVFSSEPVKSRDAVEYRYALVGDVKLYLRRLEWYDAYILLCRMVKPHEEPVVYRDIPKLLKQAGHPYPRAFNHHNHVYERFRKVIRPLAEDHFRERGYLR